MMYDYAVSLVKKGVSVMPVGRDKKPLLETWKEYQTRLPSEAELQKWFKGDAQLGIITGAISNLSVVDVDTKHGGTTKGLPPTLVAKTQSGGWHYYYRYLPGLPNKAGIRQGIDIRSDGGYVVAPPSQGKEGNYSWAVIEEPQPFPADVLDVPIGKSPVDWQSIAAGVGEGSRNEMAAKFIGKLMTTFKPNEWENAVWLTALNWNRSNKPPLPEDELRAVYNSIASRQIKNSPKNEDAPVVLMSQAAKLFQDDTSAWYETGFKTLDKAIGGGLRDGNLFVIVGPSGMGKSTVARTVTCNMLDNNITSVWFTFELTIAEMWEKFQEMGMKDDAKIYTPERYVTRKLEWLKSKIVEARDVYKCKVAFIDHLGFLVGEYDGKLASGAQSNLANVYAMICRDLKTIALQENMIIVLMWHLKKLDSHKKEADENDIKDSSGVIQEADLVINVQREKEESKGFISSDVFSNVSRINMLKSRRTGGMKRFQAIFKDGKLVEDSNLEIYDEV